MNAEMQVHLLKVGGSQLNSTKKKLRDIIPWVISLPTFYNRRNIVKLLIEKENSASLIRSVRTAVRQSGAMRENVRGYEVPIYYLTPIGWHNELGPVDFAYSANFFK
jgi:hypothetical protein